MKQPLQHWPPGFQTRTVAVIRGDFQVSSDPSVVLSTVLGSCVSVCMFDPGAKIGGMNHYLLAEGTESDASSLKYGAHAMELLINNLLKQGAKRGTLRAKVFGGSRMTGRFADIGPRNAEFALRYLAAEDFDVQSHDLGGNAARRVNFHPVTGYARVIHTAPDEETTVTPARVPLRPPASRTEGITLF
ncbi:chemotaxis protein CheD [Pararhodobacter zhoushanensis]|uniref:Probable chemoreceptor glutamine deamidase CheD n=1 Tax=Pararhodobacter zhoushanensis TaxID=2479545 RepID=A0ABT3GWY8_9RHOB|nr:chemotaxis protein CheD [Pararhodobacter zhoushanensis]MCW1932020.1 chemotaxis protein CheD [Pararhodobacter zhoushanensis]